MKVTVIGVGYVGLTTGVALAYLGHEVVGLDVDEHKVQRLASGDSPIYEPHLVELMELAGDRLTFTTDYAKAVPQADVVFIAVGTPSLPDGNPDLKYLKLAAEEVGRHLGDGFTVVVNKSTVPVGSGNWVESLVRDAFEARNGHAPDGQYAVTSNPEFLKEGTALADSLYPDRIVVGAEDSRAVEVMYSLYKPIIEQTFPAPNFLPRPEGLSAVPFITTDIASAELIKYAANAFLALKISFINEIAELAEKVGADVTRVAQAIGLDSRIGSRFLQAGIGWGGSCFGKDTAALVATAREYGVQTPIVQAAREVNYKQRKRIVDKLQDKLKILKGRTVGLLGLAFKPNTDDLRDSPARDIAQSLIGRGVKVKLHDPVATDNARKEWADLDACFCDTADQVAEGADAVLLVTEWPEYRTLDWQALYRKMRHPLVVDGRNFLDQDLLKKLGFEYVGMGVGAGVWLNRPPAS